MNAAGLNCVAIGDLYIPCPIMGSAIELLKPARLQLLEWKAADLAELQARLLLVEKHGPEAIEPPPEIWECIGETEFLMTHLCPVSRKVIEAAPKLKILGVCRGGTDSIDKNTIQKRNIKVFNAPGRNANAVAEMTLGLILAESRNIARAHCSMATGGWRKEFLNDGKPVELREKVVGLVGFGIIGRKVARLLKAFEVELLVYDPQVGEEEIREAGAKKTEFSDLLAKSDFITLHARRSPEEGPLFSTAEFQQMKPTAYLINTARACLIDEDALCDALDRRQIGGAALDVFEQEPLPLTSRLRTLDNVTLTTHLAGSTLEAWTCAPGMVVDAIIKNGVA